MEEDAAGGGSASPVSDTLSGEYYYLKALRYIEASAPHPGGSDDDDDDDDDHHHCRCLHCSSAGVEMDEDDVHFTTGFRPGLALDSLHHAGVFKPPSSTLSQYSASPPSTSSPFSSSVHFQDLKSDMSCSSKAGLKSESGGTGGNSGSRKSHMKRKLSDGHVHWADEFQKDLTRCHPRKSYTRHPGLHAPHVRPILKANPEDCDCS